MPEILAIIPARAGSKRIPDKNIKELGGRPLIEWTIISAAACRQIDNIVITSNISSLQRYEGKYEHLSYLVRPEALCGDDTRDWPVIAHVIENYGGDWDLIVYLRPTTPFRADYHLCTAIDEMLSAGCNATRLRSVELMSESAFKCFTMPTLWLAPITEDDSNIDATDMPNQMVTPTYKPNGYIDIYKPGILAKGQLRGGWCAGYVTPHTVEIDNMDDWAYAEYLANRRVDAPMRFGRKEINQ